MKLTVIELFAGVGGFRVGLNNITKIDSKNRAIEDGKWDFIWANQFEPSTKVQYAFDCYATRFGEENISNEDINKVKKNLIPKHSLLVGGFPCQDYSVARTLSNEKGIEGKKGVLFWDIKDILVEKETPFVLLENVDRLLKSPSIKRGRDFAIMLKTFDELGYNVEWRVLNAAKYSMPQKRKRVFIFAHKKKLNYSKNFFESDTNILNNNLFNKIFPLKNIETIEEINLKKYKDIYDISENYSEGKFLDTGMMLNGEVFTSSINEISEPIFSLGKILEISSSFNQTLDEFIIENDNLEKWRYLKGSKKINRVSKTGYEYTYSEGTMAFPENLNEPARTMLTSESTLNRSSHVILDENIKKYRTLTPIECELIQMFPVNWTSTMPKRNRYFMMGNALVTGIIKRLEPKLREIIENEDELNIS
ncbi:DNA (cytosine-5-)-methyltransferase [Fusobacterium simiae]|uniref:Cytosine-specific methyltransferase n=1 Tax=Fusobacterium simiae TaxID=855 RepID=A0ABT4DI62_FUSSI|nr:DNA (cytosine-5-)-methyltransferase [Fusobacterium simiae]MCY7007066.1 DNA (cytosine-5-)-methyltransferase [Fusobacterium simiae]